MASQASRSLVVGFVEAAAVGAVHLDRERSVDDEVEPGRWRVGGGGDAGERDGGVGADVGDGDFAGPGADGVGVGVAEVVGQGGVVHAGQVGVGPGGDDDVVAASDLGWA